MSEYYETMYILRPDLNEEQVDLAIARYQNILRESGVQEIALQQRGKRRLAYEIDRHREGIYVQMNYEAEGKAIAPMERAMRLSEEVIRYLTLKQDAPVVKEEETVAEVAEEKAPANEAAAARPAPSFVE